MAAIRVDHLCTYTSGGAATAARRLHEGLRQQGVSSRFLHRGGPRDEVDDPSYLPLQFRPATNNFLNWTLFRKIKKAWRKRTQKDYRYHLANRPEGLELFSLSTLVEETIPDENQPRPDILQLHWIAHFLDYASFFGAIEANQKIVWTLHDMNPFTGGCHYTSGCDRFTGGCGECPQIRNGSPDDVSKRSHSLKRDLLHSRNLTIVTPSRWLGEEAMRSSVLGPQTRFEVIPYGLDTSVFRPIDKAAARKELGLGSDDLVVAFAAEDLKSHRKGMAYLWDALDHIESKQPVIGLLFGSGESDRTPAGLDRIHAMGYVKEDERKTHLYSAADVFVMPSLEDNQPQTGLEAMACGTPVVAFDAGGIPEYVRSGKTGLLAQVANAEDLARQLSWVLNNDHARVAMGGEARNMIEREFPLHRQAQRYQRLYEDLLSEQLSPAASRRRAS